MGIPSLKNPIAIKEKFFLPYFSTAQFSDSPIAFGNDMVALRLERPIESAPWLMVTGSACTPKVTFDKDIYTVRSENPGAQFKMVGFGKVGNTSTKPLARHIGEANLNNDPYLDFAEKGAF